MHTRTFTFWTRAVQALLLAAAVCFSVGATDAGSRADYLSHQLMCTCGCSQLLGECDHAGCPSRGEEMAMLDKAVTTGETDKQIMDDFAVKYGATVLAAPKTEGFDLVAWIAPFAVFAAALLGTILLVKRWSTHETAKVKVSNDAAATERRERIRRETEDGGF